MLHLDSESKARFGLIALVAVLLTATVITSFGRPAPRALALAPDDSRAGRAASNDSAILRELHSLLARTPTAAQLRRVIACVEHSSWNVAASAVAVLHSHQLPNRASADLRLIERAIDGDWQRGLESNSLPARVDCIRAVRDVLSRISAPQDERACELLVAVFERCPDGPCRARAVELLAARPPHDWQRLVIRAIEDPSERTRLAALAIVERERWVSAWPLVESLADSARPSIRTRAAEVLSKLGRRGTPGDYSNAVMREVRRLSDRDWPAGVDLRELFPANEPAGAGGSERERLLREAEDYLDRFAGRQDDSRDFHGVVLLVAAWRANVPRLVLRLWEHEFARTDSDDELFDHGLESLAQNRLLAALAACRSGDRTTALRELSELPAISSLASSDSAVRVLARQAAELSQSIWDGTMTTEIVRGPRPHRWPAGVVVDSVRRVLGDLDVKNPSHRDELLRRLDAWCGLTPPSAFSQAARMAN